MSCWCGGKYINYLDSYFVVIFGRKLKGRYDVNKMIVVNYWWEMFLW